MHLAIWQHGKLCHKVRSMTNHQSMDVLSGYRKISLQSTGTGAGWQTRRSWWPSMNPVNNSTDIQRNHKFILPQISVWLVCVCVCVWLIQSIWFISKKIRSWQDDIQLFKSLEVKRQQHKIAISAIFQLIFGPSVNIRATQSCKAIRWKKQSLNSGKS